MTASKRNITIHDIAKELNITASTVSRALNNHPRISIQTKELVQAKALELGYQPNVLASNLRTGKGNTIGVIVPRINRHFFSGVIAGIERIAREKGFNILIGQTHESQQLEEASIKAMLNARVAGILISLSAETIRYDHLLLAQEKNVDIVFFDRACDEIQTSSVVVDDEQTGVKIAKHFLERGARSFAHLSGPAHISVYRNRKNGFINTLTKNGVAVDEISIYDHAITQLRGEEIGNEMLKNNCIPDAIFCAGDYAALGIIQALKKAGIKIPENCMVAGVANEPFTSLITPSLTSFEQYAERIGETAVRLFFEQQEKDVKIHQKVVIDATIIERESTMRKI